MSFIPGLDSLKNIHPLLVHFPAAIIPITVLFEGLWWFTKKKEFRSLATYLLYLSALSAVAAVFTGYIASNGLGHDSPGHEFVHEHRDVILWMSSILLITALSVIFFRSLREGQARRFLIIPLFVIGSLLVYGADKGGRLVFEFGVGVNVPSTKFKHTDEPNAHKHDNQEHHKQEDSEPELNSQHKAEENAHAH